MAKRVLQSRSGTFRVETGASPANIKIVDLGEKRHYRIFNSSRDVSFDVKGHTVGPKCSIDVHAKAIAVAPPADSTVEGSYDELDSSTNVRSGRFSDINAQTTVVDDVSDHLFRFFNSGRRSYEVSPDDGVTWIPVEWRFSLDVAASDNVRVRPAPSVADPIEGIYELLHGATPVRSGRFRVKAGDHPDTARLLIDLRNAAATEDYRLFNTCDSEIWLVNDPADTVAVVKVSKDQCLDFTADLGKAYYVRSAVPDEVLSGILDILPRLS